MGPDEDEEVARNDGWQDRAQQTIGVREHQDRRRNFETVIATVTGTRIKCFTPPPSTCALIRGFERQQERRKSTPPNEPATVR
jgi:hypothetical protein